MRLYWLLIRFLRLVNLLYFIEIRTAGREHVPAAGPVILAANHPSSILDSILLATQIQRPIHYLARSGLFRFPVLAALFRQLGAVPIFRPHETGDYAERNLAVFDKVYELLDAGGCVGIFPEGRNSPPTQIGPLRKGAARMALGAEARQGYRMGLQIVPVGVNFESRGFLMSAVLLRFGTPIVVADYAELHRQNPEQAFAQLTDDIRAALGEQAVHIDNQRLGELGDDLAEVFGEELARRFGLDDEDPDQQPSAIRRMFWKMASWYRRTTPEHSRAFERRMHSRHHINQVLHQAWRAEPQAVIGLAQRLERYHDHLRQTELKEALAHSFDTPVRQRLIRLRMTLYSVFMAPAALFGLAHNVIPYLATKWLAQLNRDEAVRAFAYFGLGVIFFGLTYGLFGYWLWRHTDLSLPWTAAYLTLLPPTGFAALSYRRKVLMYRDRILVRTIFFNRRDLVALLRRERKMLGEQFQALAERHAPGHEPN